MSQEEGVYLESLPEWQPFIAAGQGWDREHLQMLFSGRPHPKKRPRFGQGGAFDAPANREAEGKILQQFYAQCTDYWSERLPFIGKVYLHLTFGFNGHDNNADLDNLIKTVCDALNGALWADDSQIVRISAEKYDAQEDFTLMRVELFQPVPGKRT